jgi:hypothetical protein
MQANNLKKIKWNWRKIKELYIDSNPELMQKFIEFRAKMVNGILNKIFKHFHCNDNVSCTLTPTGSTGSIATLKSDLDFNLTAKIHNTYLAGNIIRIYQSALRESLLGKNNRSLPSNASAYIFDTNIYAYGPMEKQDDDNFANKNLFNLFHTVNNGDWYYLPINKNYDQDCWAVSHLLAYYDSFTNVPFIIKKSRQFRSFLKRENPNLTKTDDANKYLECIQNYENYRISATNDTQPKIEKQLKMLNLLSQIASNTSESYYSIGAFNHVVGSMFFFNSTVEKEPDKTFIDFLSTTALIHSIIDNLAFFVDTYILHRDNILYSLKYLERIMNAFKILLLKSGIIITSDTEDIDNIFYIMTLLKQHIRNRTSGEIIKNISDYPDIAKFIGDDSLTWTNKVGGANMQNNMNPSLNSQYPSQNMDPTLNSQYPSQNMDPTLNSQYPSQNMDPSLNTQGPTLNMDPTLNSQYPSQNMDPTLNSQYPSQNMDPTLNTQGPTLNMDPTLNSQYPSQNMDPTLNTQDPTLNIDPTLNMGPTQTIDPSLNNTQDTSKIKKAIDIKFKRLFKTFVVSYLITDANHIKKFNKIVKKRDNMNFDNMNFYILVILFSLKKFCNDDNTHINIKTSKFPIVINL